MRWKTLDIFSRILLSRGLKRWISTYHVHSIDGVRTLHIWVYINNLSLSRVRSVWIWNYALLIWRKKVFLSSVSILNTMIVQLTLFVENSNSKWWCWPIFVFNFKKQLWKIMKFSIKWSQIVTWCSGHGFTTRNTSSWREWRQLPGQRRWSRWMWGSRPTEVVPQNVAATSHRGKRSRRGTL